LAWTLRARRGQPALLQPQSFRIANLALFQPERCDEAASCESESVATVWFRKVAELDSITKPALGFADGSHGVIQEAREIERGESKIPFGDVLGDPGRRVSKLIPILEIA
jgi:hypothetical protein